MAIEIFYNTEDGGFVKWFIDRGVKVDINKRQVGDGIYYDIDVINEAGRIELSLFKVDLEYINYDAVEEKPKRKFFQSWFN